MSEKQQQIGVLLLVGFIILFFVAIFASSFKTTNTVQAPAASSLDLNPTKSSQPVPTHHEDPIFNWEQYTNDEYHFLTQIPEGWKKQIYPQPDQKKGLLIAFSPDPLPCESCSYYQDGYFSIKIYNEKTNKEDYANYLQRVAGIGKTNEVQQILVDGQKAIFSGNSITVEHTGWIYELNFDKDKGTAKVTDSPIFLKFLSSFKFTDLIFVK